MTHYRNHAQLVSHFDMIGFLQARKYVLVKLETSGQSYNGSTIVNYDSRGIPDWKIAYIMTLDS